MYQTTALVSHQIVSNRIRVDDLMEKYEWNEILSTYYQRNKNNPKCKCTLIHTYKNMNSIIITEPNRLDSLDFMFIVMKLLLLPFGKL